MCLSSSNLVWSTTAFEVQWGLIPSWTQPNAAGKVSALINARRETIQELPSFAGALKARVSRRCVVVSTGFFEWEKGLTKTARKTPYLINLGDPQETEEMLFMAGIYDVWNPPGSDEPLYSFTICTTAASEQFSWLHHRLPCILATQEDVENWLDVGGIPGEEAADKVLKTLHSGLVWRQMSQDLERVVAAPRSQNVKLDVKKYFAPQKSEGASVSSFPRSFAERVGYSQLPPLQKLASLESPIKKNPKRSSSNALASQLQKTGKTQGAKVTPKKPDKPGQRKITSFFRKVE